MGGTWASGRGAGGGGSGVVGAGAVGGGVWCRGGAVGELERYTVSQSIACRLIHQHIRRMDCLVASWLCDFFSTASDPL